MKGVVKWYDAMHCLGFIIGEDGEEYLFRKAEVKKSDSGLFPGLCCMDKVSFQTGASMKKPREARVATNIVKEEAYNHAKRKRTTGRLPAR